MKASPVKTINERNIKLVMKNVEKTRHITKVVKVGNVSIGGMNPIVVQSMTNTDTADVQGTFEPVSYTHLTLPTICSV